MPYTSIDQLPDSVRAHLPEHAQKIYLEAFNRALRTYGSETAAFRVAWAAVKKRYARSPDGMWRPVE